MTCDHPTLGDLSGPCPDCHTFVLRRRVVNVGAEGAAFAEWLVAEARRLADGGGRVEKPGDQAEVVHTGTDAENAVPVQER